jgi:SAM-dependent methyltransferase/uncharacterized protein YbaR (Trm112 family)
LSSAAPAALMPQSPLISDALLAKLRCPYDRATLKGDVDRLVCSAGHSFPVVEGIPVMLREDVSQTLWVATASLRIARTGASDAYVDTLGLSEQERAAVKDAGPSAIDPVVSAMLVATSGLMYKPLRRNLDVYPIPEIGLPETSQAKALLDVGCNWGRWTVAAARKGYSVVGIDPSLGAVLAARRVLAHFKLTADFVVADARYLPFDRSSFDVVFSYSVLQHFSETDAEDAISEVGRVLRSHGFSMIQMANRFGVRSIYHQVRRRFRAPKLFEVRYWTPRKLLGVFQSSIGQTHLTADCFFGLGIQSSDGHLMSWPYRVIIAASDFMRALSRVATPLRYLADSVFMTSVRRDGDSDRGRDQTAIATN